MTRVELFEAQEAAFTEARVDRESNLIQNVKLLGKTSRNGRIYTEGALDDAARLYRGAKVFFDHPTDAELRARRGARSVRDLAGRIRNPRRSGDEVRGDFEVLADERTKAFVFALAEAGNLAGFSHRASGRARKDGDTEIVQGLDHVAALELVSDPATTVGLFESLENDDTPEEDEEMKIEELTLAELQSKRPELVEEIQEQAKKDSEADDVQVENKRLKEENDRLKAAEAERKRKEMTEAKLAEAKLPDTVVTDFFREQLADAEDEAAVDALIAERKELAKSVGRTGPRSTERDIDEAIGAAGSGTGDFEPVTGEVIAEAYDSLFN